MTEDNIYYTACAECTEVKAFNGSVLTKDGTVIWLAYENGYPSCSTNESDAHHFVTAKRAHKIAAEWDGMPWYYRLKVGTLRVFQIRERKVVEIVKTEVW